MASIKTALLEIVKKVIKWDKKLEIYTNGDDNAYPERMERYKNNSITAKMASEIMVQYLIGKGFGELDNIKIGGVKLIDLADDVARDLVDNRGVFIHVNYDANFDVADWSVLPFNNCRLGKKDSKEYNGKVLVSSDWNDTKIKPKVINVFNPAKEIVKYQIGIEENDSVDEIAKKMAKFQGQILYFNMDSQYYYPLARIDAVSLDCRSEYLAGVYKNEILERGFFGKTLVVTRPLIDNQLVQDALLPNADAHILRAYRDAESERENFKKTIQNFVGAGGSGGVMHMEVDFAGDDLKNAILFQNIESNINDKLFQFTEDSVMAKILMSYNNLPITLVKASEGLFSNSGDALRVAKETYWENTSKDRNKLETIVNDLLRLTAGVELPNDYVSILPLLTKEISSDTALVEKQKAQATLKGSVGGVTALLEIIRSVSARETDYNSALAIIQEIYGVDEIKARELLGTPNPTSSNIINLLKDATN